MSGSGSLFLDSGTHLIKRAVDLDKDGRYTEALSCYQEGIQLFIKEISSVPKDNITYRTALRKRIEEYMTRAEKVKQLAAVEGTNGKRHEQIRIDEDQVGMSYRRVFGPCLEHGNVEWVRIEDPYIQKFHQIQNFLQFCELVVSSNNPLKEMELVTKQPDKAQATEDQSNMLNELEQSLLNQAGVHLVITYRPELHDREVRFSNGWIVKIGRGLDYFKRPSGGRTSLGIHDTHFRQCYATTIDIFHGSTVRESNS